MLELGAPLDLPSNHAPPQSWLSLCPLLGPPQSPMMMSGSPGKKGNNKLKRLGVNISEVRQAWRR
jgi:hypothetical protein